MAYWDPCKIITSGFYVQRCRKGNILSYQRQKKVPSFGYTGKNCPHHSTMKRWPNHEIFLSITVKEIIGLEKSLLLGCISLNTFILHKCLQTFCSKIGTNSK